MISDSVKAQFEAIEQDAIIDLFVLDISQINDSGGSNQFYFCNEVNEKNEPVTWRGQSYMPIPIMLEGVELNSEGASSRPTLTVANANGYMTGIIAQYNGLMSAKLTRYRIPSRFLDEVNFINGNPSANPNEYFIQTYMVNGASSYNSKQATFQLALPSEADGVILPARTIYASICSHKYRGELCGYDGWAIADENDIAIQAHEREKDVCSKRLQGCMARFGVNGQLPFGGFVMADKVGR